MGGKAKYGKGDAISDASAFPLLYHNCEYTGYAYAIAENALRTHSYGYVSTSWDPKMNHIVGKWHVGFKLVLDGSALIEKYGAFHYADYQREVGTNRKVPMKEQEIGLDTKEVAPLREYLKGTVIFFDLMSEKGVQWLLYRNRGGDRFMGPSYSPTPQAIDALFTQVFEWRLPVWKGEVGKQFSKLELRFFKRAYEVRKMDLPFMRSLEILAHEFPIVGHRGTITSGETYVRQHMCYKMADILNKYYYGREYSKVDVETVRHLIESCVRMFGFGRNFETAILDKLTSSELYHPATPPVEWGGILRDIADGDMEKIDWTIDFFNNRSRGQRQQFDQMVKFDPSYNGGRHVATDFGRRPSH